VPNLRDLIRKEVDRGTIHEPFEVSKLRELMRQNDGLLGGELPPQHWETILANFSIGPGKRRGESVQRGSVPLFLKHEERATYSLIWEEMEDVGEAQDDGADAQATDAPRLGLPLPKHAEAKARSQSIAALVVDYLRHKPYRLMTTRVTAGHVALTWGDRTAVGWWQRLMAYQWNGADWQQTVRTVDAMVAELQSARERWTVQGNSPELENEVERIYEAIRAWGNRRGKVRQGAELLQLLAAVWAGDAPMEVDSTLTKLYAFASPEDYVIYDSRVAASIVSMAEDIFRVRGQDLDTAGQPFRAVYRHLGHYAGGRAGTRPRPVRSRLWPQAYGAAAAQMDANTLCKAIRDALNQCREPKAGEQADRPWTLREVEAVLFMDGQ
jgi:hypothetical protein